MKILGKEIILKTGQNKKPSPTGAGTNLGKGRKIDDFKAIIDKITNQFKDQSRKDIQKWRQAIKMADMPERPRLNFYHDLIDDLLTDGNLQAQIQLRLHAVLNTEFSVVENGNINEEGTALFRQHWFYEFMAETMWSILRGAKVMEFHSFNGLHIQLDSIPQRNVVPVLKMVFPDLTKEEGISYDDPYYDNWIIQVGKDKDLGILNNIVPNLIWIRNVLQAWAEFCERFGLPMIAAYTNKSDTETIDRIDYMLGRMAQAARGVFPEGSRIEFKEANRTDAYQVFDKFIDRNMRIVRQAIVGGTMLTDDGSSRSQSEVHERNLDDKIAVADKRYIEFLVNDRLLPLLRNQGYSFLKDSDRFQFNQSHNLELDKFWKITQGIMQTHDVDEEWLSKTFSIPILGKKKSMALTAVISKLEGIQLPKYPVSAGRDKHSVYGANSTFDSTMRAYHNQLLQELWDNESTLSSKAKIMALEASQFIKGLFEGWGNRRINVGYNSPDHLALQMMEFNLFEFSASKTEARLASLSQLLIDKDVLQIRSFSDFKKEAEKITANFNRNYLETEYNLSVAVGQNSARYIRFMDEKDTVTSFVRYETVGDRQVRGEHQLLDGKVFNLNDTDARNLWPPNGYGCRCEMVQHLGDSNTVVSTGSTAKRLLGNKFTGSQFDVNRGDLKQVFTKKQYYSDIKGLNKSLNTMSFDDVYKLESWTAFKQRLKVIKMDETITGDNVKELFKADGKQGKQSFMGFTDYLKRKLIMKKQVFDKHTKGSYLNKDEQRHRIFPHLENILKSPDEVWLSEHHIISGTFELRYVKFYKDKVIIVETTMGSNNLDIKTWYPLKVNEKEKRKGLLIKRKDL